MPNGTYDFKLGIYLSELQLPFEESLAVARDLGVRYVWGGDHRDNLPLFRLPDAEIDDSARLVDSYGCQFFFTDGGGLFKTVHLAELVPGKMLDHVQFKEHYDSLTRSMEVASRLGIGAVACSSFAWPGEYTAGKPTWPMRWATGGGIVSEAELRGLVEVFRRVLEAAEKHDVDVLVNQRPFHYTNTTAHFLELAERVGSGRLKAFWGPADNVLSGEREVPTRGYERLRAYLAAVHLKDVQVHDGARGEYAWKPIGDGEVGYSTLFRRLVEEDSDAVLVCATHFLPPGGGSTAEALAINHERVTSLLARVRREVAAARHKESHP